MPITQDRMITIVSTAETLLTHADTLGEAARTIKLGPLPLFVKQFLENSQDAEAKNLVSDLYSSLRELMTLISTENIPQEIRTNILREKIHFQMYRKRNETMATYRRALRERKNEVSRSYAQLKIEGEVPIDFSRKEAPQNYAPTWEPTVPEEYKVKEPKKVTDPETLARQEAEIAAHKAAAQAPAAQAPFETTSIEDARETVLKQIAIFSKPEQKRLMIKSGLWPELTAPAAAQAETAAPPELASLAKKSPKYSTLATASLPSLEELNKVPNTLL